MEMVLRRRVLRVSASTRVMIALTTTPAVRLQFVRNASTAPTIAQPSFWRSLIPKPFRQRREAIEWGAPQKMKPKEWNPATFFIVIFLFIGSMAIQMIALKQDFETFMRRSETRIGLLREVVEKLQSGEDVDVEKVLGTGDAQREKEWEEVLREIERDDVIRSSKKGEKAKQSSGKAGLRAETATQNEQSTLPPNTKTTTYSSFF